MQSTPTQQTHNVTMKNKTSLLAVCWQAGSSSMSFMSSKSFQTTASPDQKCFFGTFLELLWEVVRKDLCFTHCLCLIHSLGVARNTWCSSCELKTKTHLAYRATPKSIETCGGMMASPNLTRQDQACNLGVFVLFS